MEVKAIKAGKEMIQVSKRDLLEAWSVLEKVVVSLRKMGSHYATPDADVPMTSKQRQKMLADLDDYLSADLMREFTRARRVLSAYLPDDELERVSDQLDFWEPK